MSQPKGKAPTNITTPRGRLSFPSVFAPTLNKLSGKMEYSAQILFEEGADLGPLKLAIKNACENLFGADQSKWPVPPAQLKMPIKSQADLVAKAKEKGQRFEHLNPKAFYIAAKTPAVDAKSGKPKPPPPVVGKNPKEAITEESRFYAGCWAKLNVNAFAYLKGINAGVALGLNACQFVADGDPFSGRPSPEAAFEAIPEEATDGSGSAADIFS